MKTKALVLRFFKTILMVLRIPQKLGRKLQEALDDYAEMAPYRIRMMSMSFGGMSATGLTALKKNVPGVQAPFDPHRFRDEFTRREMLIWRFIDYDRMMFGKHDPITARQWITLGDLHWEYRHPGEARMYYQRGLKIFRLSCVNGDDRLIGAQQKLANCYMAIGSYEDAEVLLKEIAEAFEQKVNGMDSSSSGTTGSGSGSAGGKSKNSGVDLITARIVNLLALAETLKRQKKYLEAADALQQVVDIHEASGVPSGDDCLTVYNDLSSTYALMGDVVRAELFSATARQLDFMRIVEKAVGPEARSLIAELESLASLYRKRNKLEVVAALNKRIRICQLVDKVAGGNYPGIEADLESLALMFDSRQEPADSTRAFHLRARAKRIIEKLHNKVSMVAMFVAGKLSWLFSAIEGSEPLVVSALCCFV